MGKINVIVELSHSSQIEKNANEADEKKLFSGSQNYIMLLKQNKVEKNLIPFGYYVQINKQHLNTDLNLCMNVGVPGVLWFEKPTDNTVYQSQDSCKCPPTCPCPPEPIPLIYGTSIKKIIEKVVFQPAAAQEAMQTQIVYRIFDRGGKGKTTRKLFTGFGKNLDAQSPELCFPARNFKNP